MSHSPQTYTTYGVVDIHSLGGQRLTFDEAKREATRRDDLICGPGHLIVENTYDIESKETTYRFFKPSVEKCEVEEFYIYYTNETAHVILERKTKGEASARKRVWELKKQGKEAFYLSTLLSNSFK